MFSTPDIMFITNQNHHHMTNTMTNKGNINASDTIFVIIFVGSTKRLDFTFRRTSGMVLGFWFFLLIYLIRIFPSSGYFSIPKLLYLGFSGLMRLHYFGALTKLLSVVYFWPVFLLLVCLILRQLLLFSVGVFYTKGVFTLHSFPTFFVHLRLK